MPAPQPSLFSDEPLDHDIVPPGFAEDAEVDTRYFDYADELAQPSVDTYADREDFTVAPVDPEVLLDGLNTRQRDAANCLAGPLLVVAGPGSGKTKTVTHRIALLLQSGVAPWQIFAVTFTNKAAGELRERVATLVGEEAAKMMWVSTFHSACARILRMFHAEAGLSRRFTILDASDAEKVLKGIVAELHGEKVEVTEVRRIGSIISNAKNACESADDVAAKPGLVEIGRIMAAYQQRLAEMNAVDFDDLLLLTLLLLRHNAEVRDRMQRRFRHLLIDEFQDTNVVQYDIATILAAPHRNLCVVGDRDQAIYGWRGASPQAVDNFLHDFPESAVVVLDQNYRSTPAILEVVQSIIDPNPAVHRARLWTEQSGGDAVVLYEADDDRDEASQVISQIRASADPPGMHAILVRTNAQTRVIEEACTRSGTRYIVLGALRFYDRAEVRDALAYLRCAMNPSDAVNLARCINTPKRGIGDTSVDRLLNEARARSVDPMTVIRGHVAAGTAPKRLAEPLASFAGIYDDIVAACHAGPAEALRVVATTGGLRAHLLAQKDVIDRADNLDELIAAAETFVENPDAVTVEGVAVTSLSGLEQTLAFLENVALVAAADEDSDDPVGKVAILTVHASKGKEFPHVYVVGVEEGYFPHSRSVEDEASVQEERRLLFVAASRAQRTLLLSHCAQRMTFGGKIEPRTPSRFLSDLPATVEIRHAAPAPRPSWGGRGTGGSAGGRQQPAYRQAPNRTPATRFAAPPKVAVVPGPRISAAELAPGDTVVHSTFGEGTVVNVNGGEAAVRFPDRVRHLNLEFAPLRRATST